jgi:biopolymer transport protein ExbD
MSSQIFSETSFSEISLTAKKKNKRISLTPLIDAVFILLLFFMLTANFTQQHIQSLNSLGDSNDASKSSQNIIILNRFGEMLVLDDSYLPQNIEFTSNIDHVLTASDLKLPFVILPYQDTSVQFIVTMIERLQRHKINDVTIGQSIEAIN